MIQKHIMPWSRMYYMMYMFPLTCLYLFTMVSVVADYGCGIVSYQILLITQFNPHSSPQNPIESLFLTIQIPIKSQ